MAAGYSGTPLVKKLGLKEKDTVLFVNKPDNYFDLLDVMPEVTEWQSGGKADFIHFFTKDEQELNSQFPRLKRLLNTNGMLWVSWPKKSSKVETTVGEAQVRSKGLEIGLVDVKICAVDSIWSGLKFMYRVKDR